MLQRIYTRLTLLLLALGGCPVAEQELHLIPAGYQGPVLVIYGVPDGAPMRRERSMRRYDIPASGVLRTQFPPNHGWSSPIYRYVDSLGRRTLIVAGTPCRDSIPGDPVQACLDAVRIYANHASGPVYSAYVVSRRGNRSEMYRRGSMLVDTLLFKRP